MSWLRRCRHWIRERLHPRYRAMTVQSDPHAEGFYRAMGMERVGEVPSGSIPGRVLPKLRITLA